MGTIIGPRSGVVDGLLLGAGLDVLSIGFDISMGWKGDRPLVRDRFDGLVGVFQGDDGEHGNKDG
jgi:hypothetical protein